VPELIGRLADEDRAVRLAAGIALGQIGSRAATSALREHRADADDEEWTDAIDAALAEAAYADQPLFPL
jgi:HEAT repeat protein